LAGAIFFVDLISAPLIVEYMEIKKVHLTEEQQQTIDRIKRAFESADVIHFGGGEKANFEYEFVDPHYSLRCSGKYCPDNLFLKITYGEDYVLGEISEVCVSFELDHLEDVKFEGNKISLEGYSDKGCLCRKDFKFFKLQNVEV